MVAADLTDRRLSGAAAGVLATTLLGALVGAIAPALAGPTPPHPTLAGTPAEALSILAHNTAVLAIPYLLAGLGAARHPGTRRLGDLAVAAISCQSTIPVGMALAHWRLTLAPYIPQLPLEWAALTTAICAWLTARTGHLDGRALAALAATTLLLLTAAAGLETWGTPHRDTSPSMPSRRPADAIRDLSSRVGAGGCPRHGFCTGNGPVAARSQAPFPSRRSVPLGRRAGADRAPSTHRPPQRRDQMNSVNLIGRLTATPQLRTSDSGSVARLRVAVQRRRGKDGEDRGADFVDVTAFGTQAQTCAQYLTKGRRVAIVGRLHHSEWDAEDGRRQRLEVIAENVDFLDSPRESAEPPATPAAA